jgi:hypothetical protein
MPNFGSANSKTAAGIMSQDDGRDFSYSLYFVLSTGTRRKERRRMRRSPPIVYSALAARAQVRVRKIADKSARV